MSEYIEFYAKAEENNTFICLGAYSRNSYMYQAFKPYAPAYTEAKPLTQTAVAYVKEDVTDSLKDMKKKVKTLKKGIKLAMSKLSSVGAIEGMINSYQNDIEDYKEDIKSLKYILHFINFLNDIEGEIWFGIECGKPQIQEDNNENS